MNFQNFSKVAFSLLLSTLASCRQSSVLERKYFPPEENGSVVLSTLNEKSSQWQSYGASLNVAYCPKSDAGRSVAIPLKTTAAALLLSLLKENQGIVLGDNHAFPLNEFIEELTEKENIKILFLEAILKDHQHIVDGYQQGHYDYEAFKQKILATGHKTFEQEKMFELIRFATLNNIRVVGIENYPNTAMKEFERTKYRERKWQEVINKEGKTLDGNGKWIVIAGADHTRPLNAAYVKKDGTVVCSFGGIERQLGVPAVDLKPISESNKVVIGMGFSWRTAGKIFEIEAGDADYTVDYDTGAVFQTYQKER
jgi:hypothetical protein